MNKFWYLLHGMKLLLISQLGMKQFVLAKLLFVAAVKDSTHIMSGKIDELMMQEEVYTNSVKCQELAKEKAANEAELEELYEKWEELAE